MKSNYKRIGDCIRLVDERNVNLNVRTLLGLSISKEFIPSVANIIGTDMKNYKVIKKRQFACSTMQVRRDKKMPIALLENFEEALISAAYPIFEVINTDIILPEYLMMWFCRSEFDREACFYAIGGVRGSIDWEDFCNMTLPVPSISKQIEIVKEYKVLVDRINLNNNLIKKLEETAQTIYKQWFVDFEFPNEDGNSYKSNGGEMVFNKELDKEVPIGWNIGCIGDYSKVKSGYAFKSDWWLSSGIPVVKIGSIQNNTIDYNQVAYVNDKNLQLAKNYLVRKGDIVIAMTGATIGKIAIIPDMNENILVNQRVGMFTLGDEPLDKSPFLYFTLLQEHVINEMKNVGGDSAQANMSNTDIEKIQLVIPESNQLNRFNKFGKPVLNLVLSKIKENKLLIETKSFMLASIVTKEGTL